MFHLENVGIFTLLMPDIFQHLHVENQYQIAKLTFFCSIRKTKYNTQILLSLFWIISCP